MRKVHKNIFGNRKDKMENFEEFEIKRVNVMTANESIMVRAKEIVNKLYRILSPHKIRYE